MGWSQVLLERVWVGGGLYLDRKVFGLVFGVSKGGLRVLDGPFFESNGGSQRVLEKHLATQHKSCCGRKSWLGWCNSSKPDPIVSTIVLLI